MLSRSRIWPSPTSSTSRRTTSRSRPAPDPRAAGPWPTACPTGSAAMAARPMRRSASGSTASASNGCSSRRSAACRRDRMRYVALGDSYTIGTAVPAADRFPDQLVRATPDLGLELVANLGVDGYTTADLIRDELPALVGAAPELVTLLIGV